MGTFVEESFLDTRLNASKNACKYSAQILRRYSPPKPLCYGSLFSFPEESKIFPQTEGSQFGFVL